MSGKIALRSVLQERVLVGDGAMGTYLHALGYPIGAPFEEYNLTQAETIAKVHRQYYDAGARLIETNTYSASRDKLARHGLEDETAAINRKGAELARSAVGQDAYIVGTVSSLRTGRRKPINLDALSAGFSEQMAALLEGGVDGLLLETFFELDEMLAAIRAARRLSADTTLICQFAADPVGRTVDGHSYSDAIRIVRDEGADVFGFNCRSGPFGVMKAIETLEPGVLQGLPLSVYPNAGLPEFEGDTYRYSAGPQYFADNAKQFAARGARIIGGCCGTTPAHIEAIAAALKGMESVAELPAVSVPEPITVGQPQPQPEQSPPAQPNLLDLVAQRHTVIVELDPPRDLEIARFMKGAEALRDAGADAITMADSALAVTRMSNLALGHLVKQQLGVETVLHLTCRDRNLIGTQSHLMGFHALGQNHVLVITGDPPRFGDLPGASSVYDMTSFETIRMIKQLNEGIAFSGKPLKQKANFIVAAAFNPNVKYLEKAVQRLEKKVEAGADMIMTQPIYDGALIERVYEATRHLSVPIFIGIMPFTSGRNAEFLHNEVPGIQLPEEVRRRMAGLEGEEGRRVSLEIAKELLHVSMNRFKGVYLITPMLAYSMTVELTKFVWDIVPKFGGVQAGNR